MAHAQNSALNVLLPISNKAARSSNITRGLWAYQIKDDNVIFTVDGDSVNFTHADIRMLVSAHDMYEILTYIFNSDIPNQEQFMGMIKRILDFIHGLI